MYKYRFSRWGVKTDKKMKEHEAREFVQNGGQPQRSGRRMDNKRVAKYFKRKGIAIKDALHSNSNSITDSSSDGISPESSFATMSSPDASPSVENEQIPVASLQCSIRRPDPMGSLQQIESPDSLKLAEHLFADICEYFRGSVGSGVWLNVGLGHACKNTRDQPIYLGEFYQKFNLAASQVDSFELNKAETAFADALAFTPAIIRQQGSGNIPDLIRLIAELLRKNKYPMVAQFCKRLSTTFVSGPIDKDPLTIIFRRVFASLPEVLRDGKSGHVLLNAICAIMETFGQTLGEDHMETIFATRDFFTVIKNVSGSDCIEPHLMESYQACVALTGPQSLQSVNLQFELAQHKLNVKQYPLAAKYAEEGIRYAESLVKPGDLTAVRLLLDACWVSGQAHEMLGSHDVVEKRYRQAVHLNECAFGLEGWSTKRDRTILWRWLLQQDRVQDAAAVEARGSIEKDECVRYLLYYI